MVKLEELKTLDGQKCLDCQTELIRFTSQFLPSGVGWRCKDCGAHYTLAFYKQLARDLEVAYREMMGESSLVLAEEDIIQEEAEINLGEEKTEGVPDELLKLLKDKGEERKSDALEKFEKPIEEV